MATPATQKVVRPAISGYTNTYANQYGQGLAESETKGDIGASGTTLVADWGGVEFSTFEAGVRDHILAELGHPMVRVELGPVQLKLAVNKAVHKMNNHAPVWATQFATFKTVAGFGLYELPSHIVNNLTYVVYKKAILSIQSLAGTLEQDFFIRYFQENFIFQDFSIGDFFLLQQHLEMIRKVLGNDGSWNVINNQYVQLYPTPVVGGETVILEFRALDTDRLHPAYRTWIQEYATAQAMMILGRVRGKYKQLPGPGGGAQLDGPELRQEARAEIDRLELQLIDEFEEPPVFTTF